MMIILDIVRYVLLVRRCEIAVNFTHIQYSNRRTDDGLGLGFRFGFRDCFEFIEFLFLNSKEEINIQIEYI